MQSGAIARTSGCDSAPVQDRERGSSRDVVVRYDGEQIYLPGARFPINLDAARQVWEHGRCDESTADLFFPETGQPSRAALELCESCPVRALCLETFGPVVDHWIVGGVRADQRSAMRAGGDGDGRVA